MDVACGPKHIDETDCLDKCDGTSNEASERTCMRKRGGADGQQNLNLKCGHADML